MTRFFTRWLLLAALATGPAGLAQDLATTSPAPTRLPDGPLVTLSAEGRTLDKLLRDIEQQTNYTFIYSDTRLAQHRPGMAVVAQPLRLVLDNLLLPLAINYRLVGRQIILATTDERVLTGRVTSADGEALPGVSVTLKGTKRGTATDATGNYKLTLDNSTSELVTLVFSYVGFLPQEVVVGSQTLLNVTLQPDERSLNEVQVVAFGEQRTRDLTGSFATLKSRDIALSTAASPDVALQGRAAGVQITQAGGTPGGAVRINVRGVASINSNAQPLIVIDGVPVLSSAFGTGGIAMNPLAEINPNDIESMEILKDASASVLFGSRAANGVILITTKRGASGKPRFDLSYEEGFSSPTNRVDFVDNGADLLNLYKRSAQNMPRTGLTPIAPTLTNLLPTGILRGTLTPALDPRLVDSTTLYNSRTNWLDQVLRQGRQRQVSLSVGVGKKWVNAYVSGSYRRDDGIMIGQGLERVSGRVKFDLTPTKWLQAGVNGSVNHLDNPTVPLANSFGQAVTSALPAYPIQLPDGTYFNGLANGTNNTVNIGTNPVFFRNNYANTSKTFRSINTGYVQVKPVAGLTIRSEVGYDYQRTRSDILLNPTLYPAGIQAQERSGNGRAENRLVTNQTINLNNLVTYERTINNDHALKFLVGNNLQSTRTDNETYITENVPDGADRGRDTIRAIAFTDQLTYRFVSFFGRANYTFRNKYLLEASLRSDGSSRFGPGNRWATFPSVSAGWIISEEAFLKQNPAISFLKLRLSYGLTGNAEIGNFSWQRGFQVSGYNAAIYGGVQGGQFISLGNEQLSWESTRQFNAGLDFGFLNDRIRGTFDYYDKVSDGLLLDYDLGPLFGVISNIITVNLGSVRNRGVEFSLNTENIRRGRFRWSTSFNIARNQNTVLSTYDAPFRNYPFQFISGTNIATPGQPLGAYYLPQFAGFDPQTGNELFYERNRTVFNNTGQTTRTGNLWDGTINNQAGNNQFIQSDKTPYPVFFGGLTNTFQLGPIDLSALVYFQYGNWIYDQGERIQSYPQQGLTMRRNVPGVGDVQQLIGQDNTTALNRLIWTSNARNVESTRFLHDGSFARLKNLQVGYTLPASVAQKFRMRTLRLTLTGQNLLTITKYPGWDPEVLRNGGFGNNGDANLAPGVTNNDLPQLRTYVVGLTLGF